MTEFGFATDHKCDFNELVQRRVFGRMMQAFRQSVRDAGCPDHLWNSICRFLGDNLAKAEPEIRRDIQKAHKLPETEGLLWAKVNSTGS